MAIFVGDQEPDALVWLGLQKVEVSAVAQCSWVPVLHLASIRAGPSAGPRPDLLLSACSRHAAPEASS